MTQIIYVGGYANSGKSSTIKKFKELGIPAYSTSLALHDICTRLLKHTFKVKPKELVEESYCEYKDYKIMSNMFFGSLDRGYILNTAELNVRDFMISVAEEVLVPVVGREAFVLALMKKIKSDNHPLVVIETIGGDEYELTKRYAKAYGFSNSMNINCRLKGILSKNYGFTCTEN